MPKKTTQKDFEVFKSEFLRWRRIFGLERYDITFQHGNTQKDRYAEISTNTFTSSTAIVRLSKTASSGADALDNDPKSSALHEALELLLVELNGLAESRYGIEEYAIEGATHRIINVLMPLLAGMKR